MDDLYDVADVFGIDLTPLTALTARDSMGRFTRTLDQAEIDADAARLRARGKSYRQIAAIMGCSAPVAHDRVRRALAAVPAEAVDELRTIEGERLDLLLQEAERILATNHVMVSHGRIIRGDDGEPLIDDGPKLQAIAQLRFLSESRRKLTGADAPVKVETKVTIEETTVMDAEIRELVEQFKAHDQPAGA